jgi:alkanesulfonate monooxygenase SsuD/methylene tetrahydromethanopterin reductase-like flavin-dependent oxidoreductase (luciferase family)
MVTGMTHRPPAVLFNHAVTVDHVSGGRLILSVVASWSEREHQAYGLEFPSAKERVDRFGEAMEMYRLLGTQERTTFNGEHYQLVDAPFEPKPGFGHIPIMIGTSGKRMMRHVARYADRWDGHYATPQEYQIIGTRLAAYCEEIGRDPAEIRWVRQSGKQELDLVACEDTFRRHVVSYVRAGVRSFIFWCAGGSPDRALVIISENVIPELRLRFHAGELTH